MSLTVGQRIQGIRGAMGVMEFAERLGVNRKTITRWEADEALPDGASLLALLEKFGADPAWVLAGTGASPSLAPDEAALLDNYRHAPEDQQRLLRETGAAFAKRRGSKRSA